jgi:hypothetical protein
MVGAGESSLTNLHRIKGTRSSLLVLAIAVLSAFALAIGAIGLAKPLWPTLSLATEPPGAKVILDGRALTVGTPLKVRVKPYFGHLVVLELDGHPARTIGPIDVGFGERPSYAIRFERVRHLVNILGMTGKVTLNGKVAGSGRTVELPTLERDKPIELKVEAAGMKPWLYTFDKLASLPVSLDIPLEPLAHR